MLYADGTLVRLGDRVELWAGCEGVVVCSLDTNEFSESFPQADWEYLKCGVLIEVEGGELFYYPEFDETHRPLPYPVPA